MSRSIGTSIIKGTVAALALLSVYFVVLTLVSGWNFTVSQFTQFWYFIVTLALGFGIQIGLYSYLKSSLRHGDASGKMVAVTGTTSTAAMVSCCAHYLVNILPVLGIGAFASFVGAYQVQLFWVGIAFNLLGIAFIARRIIKVKTLTP